MPGTVLEYMSSGTNYWRSEDDGAGSDRDSSVSLFFVLFFQFGSVGVKFAGARSNRTGASLDCVCVPGRGSHHLDTASRWHFANSVQLHPWHPRT
eukprot:SAG31_NODE_198_length_20656_cov_5.167291_20_plen_95_part_00